MRKGRYLMSVLGLLAITGVARAQAASTAGRNDAQQRSFAESFTWKDRLPIGGTVEVLNVKGAIEVASGLEEEVEIAAVFDSTSGVQVEVVAHASGVRVCAIVPPRPGAARSGCGGGATQTVNDGSAPMVAFTLKVPTSSRLVARTGTGNILVRRDRTDWSGSTELTTGTGSITAHLPAGASTVVRAATGNGRIVNELGSNQGTTPPPPPAGPTGAPPATTPRALSITLGDGGRMLKMATGGGDLWLRR
jgi:hypothetical protein